MRRLVGEGAHVAEADIEQMVGVARVIGRARSQGASALDEGHTDIARASQQVDRSQQAAEADAIAEQRIRAADEKRRQA